MTEPVAAPTLPLARWHRSLFIAGVLLALLPPLVHAYLLMPFPGSQDLEAIKVAYYLEKALAPLVIVGVLLLGLPVLQVVRHGTLGRRIGLGGLALVAVAVAYLTTAAFSAEKMFREPTTLIFAAADRNAVPLDAVVLGIEHGGAARAYPIDLMGYHHKVLDTVGGRPVLVTYCTMCRTGRVYSPVVDGVAQRFRLVGARHYNAVLEDEQTGTWWYQGSGRAAVGPRAGKQLGELEYAQMTLRSWLAAHPESTVLQPDPGFAQEYKDFAGYDRRRPATPADRDAIPMWGRRTWVLGVTVGSTAKAFLWDDLVSRRVTSEVVGDVPIVIVIEKDGATFHAFRRDFDGETLDLSLDSDNDVMRNSGDGSPWTFQGEGRSMRHFGRRLTPVQAHQEYWHSWKTFHPATATWSATPL